MNPNNRRIAKNTLYLYFRSLLTMGVSLFTSRVVLEALGVEDYGLNNVISGVTFLFSFLNGSLAHATSRFMTFELGRKDERQLKIVFATAFNIHLVLAVIVVLLCETVGLWLVNNVLTIPHERLPACNVIYQFVVVAAALNITQVPMHASIIARERMNVFALIGVFDSVMKLCIAYLVMISSSDKLITLGALQLLTVTGIYVFYHYYCHRNFSEYNFSKQTNKPLMKSMLSFSSWSLLGNGAVSARTQGVDILINIFFGPAVNAANAIASQINRAVEVFSYNFSIAMRPQIVKQYAAGKRDDMKKLVLRGSKFSFFLVMILAIPVLLETDFLLKIWLKSVPEYTVLFAKLTVLLALVRCFYFAIDTSIEATGRVKYYQIVRSAFVLAILPVSYLLYARGWKPETALLVTMVAYTLTLIALVYLQKAYLQFPVKEYFKRVLLVSVAVFIASIIPPYLVRQTLSDGFLRLFAVCITSLFSSGVMIYFLGLRDDERELVKREALLIFF
ncbi:MAG: hypothetical protein LBR13_01855 [Dysgonamonadaceae bacterium]|jgi:O-antigen/teichoic acid export membrane protein|nr:hypothetical protein [Dysgonamonadaceae bacterium]